MNKTARTNRGAGFWRRAIGFSIAPGIFVLTSGILLAVLGANAPDTSPRLEPDIAHLVRMSTIQAALSTALSLATGLAIAWSLNGLRFFGRNLVISFFAAAIVAPAIVLALGLLAIWGRAGWINGALEVLGLNWRGSIFGLGGILLAHTILNGAFAARVLLARLQAIPSQRLKTAQSLALSPLQRFMVIDWPALSGALPALGAIIFLLAFTSFPTVLLLGGGPANQTLEVAIYAAVHLSFDLKTAVTLALVQLTICLFIIIPVLISTPSLATAGSQKTHYWPSPLRARLAQVTILVFALFAFGLPLLAVLARGLGSALAPLLLQRSFWFAAASSISIGLVSALLTLVLAMGIGMARNSVASRLGRMALGLPAFAYLVVPALVLSLGFFLMVRQLGIPVASAAPIILILANALLALPFAISILAPALDAISARYDKTSLSLGLTSSQRLRLVEWPLMGHEIGLALAFGFCFSLGDLGVIALFGTSDFSTLPWLMFRAAGAYRTGDASAIAALLLIISLGVFWGLPPLMRKLSHA